MAARPYESLTYQGQVRRMRALARAALPRFDLPVGTPLEFLHHGENTTFRVHAEGRGPFVLRIHRLDYQSPKNIRSEMAWLRALARDTSLVVPRPEPGADGHYVQRVSQEGVPGERSCVLMRWIDGRFSSDRPGRLYFERLGALMGALHAHARSWSRPPEFERSAWDLEGLLGRAALWGYAPAAPGLTPEQRALLERGIVAVSGELRRFGTAPERFGLIHADMHMGNVLFSDGRMAAIDFDDCGDGWFLCDIVVAAGFAFRDPERGPARRRWFFSTYRRHVDIPEEDLEMIETFWTARRLAHLGWVGTRSDVPRLAAYLPKAAQTTCEAVRAYLKE